MINPSLHNAQLMKELHPDTFHAPSLEDLSKITVDSLVKIATLFGAERFWVKVTEVDGDSITGTVENDLLFTDRHGYKDGDTLSFCKHNVYNIYEGF